MRIFFARRWGRRPGDQRGDTIVEVLICIAVIALVLAAAFGLTQKGTLGLEDSQEHATAAGLAESQLEQLRTALNGDDATLADSIVNATQPFCMSNAQMKLANTTACQNQSTFFNLSITHPNSDLSTYKVSVTWDAIVGGQGSEDFYYRVYKNDGGLLTPIVTPPPQPAPPALPSCPALTLAPGTGSNGHSVSISLARPAGTPEAGVTWSYTVKRTGKSFSGSAPATYTDTGLAYGTTYTYTVDATAYSAATGLTASQTCTSRSVTTHAPSWTTIYLCWLPRQHGTYEMFQTTAPYCSEGGSTYTGAYINIISLNSQVLPSTLQIWRIYNPTTGDHALTTSTSGIWSGYQYEGTYGYSDDATGHRVDSWIISNNYYWNTAHPNNYTLRTDHSACPAAWGAGACGTDQGGPLFYAQ